MAGDKDTGDRGDSCEPSEDRMLEAEGETGLGLGGEGETGLGEAGEGDSPVHYVPQ